MLLQTAYETYVSYYTLCEEFWVGHEKSCRILSGDSAASDSLFFLVIPCFILLCRTGRRELHSCRSTVVRRKRNKKSAAAAMPTGYVTSVERPKPSFACRMYVTVTADMKVAGIMPMM